jgi:5-(carboxyamino)imidazole ribonucleotide synthase
MRIGVLGGSELARLLALAGHPLGYPVRILAGGDVAAVEHVAECFAGSLAQRDGLAAFVQDVDVVTFDDEQVPIEVAEYVQQHAALYPPRETLVHAQDRILEKRLFERLDIPMAEFAEVDTLEDLNEALEDVGTPALLKTRRRTHDGHGQRAIQDPSEAREAFDSFAGQPLLVEGFVRYDREVSLTAVRNRAGEIQVYPLVEHAHRDNILYKTVAPASGTSLELQALAAEKADRVLRELDYVGVITLELFEVSGRLFADEMIPRVHSTGNWTLAAARTSQYENHLRAILGLPLGDAGLREPSITYHLVGGVPPLEELLGFPGVRVHLYHKPAAARVKLGHVTVCGASEVEVAERAARVAPLIDKHWKV